MKMIEHIVRLLRVVSRAVKMRTVFRVSLIASKGSVFWIVCEL
jgi:hypothetical protein